MISDHRQHGLFKQTVPVRRATDCECLFVRLGVHVRYTVVSAIRWTEPLTKRNCCWQVIGSDLCTKDSSACWQDTQPGISWTWYCRWWRASATASMLAWRGPKEIAPRSLRTFLVMMPLRWNVCSPCPALSHLPALCHHSSYTEDPTPHFIIKTLEFTTARLEMNMTKDGHWHKLQQSERHY